MECLSEGVSEQVESMWVSERKCLIKGTGKLNIRFSIPSGGKLLFLEKINLF